VYPLDTPGHGQAAGHSAPLPIQFQRAAFDKIRHFGVALDRRKYDSS
jgi:hypothetical protein